MTQEEKLAKMVRGLEVENRRLEQALALSQQAQARAEQERDTAKDMATMFRGTSQRFIDVLNGLAELIGDKPFTSAYEALGFVAFMRVWALGKLGYADRVAKAESELATVTAALDALRGEQERAEKLKQLLTDQLASVERDLKKPEQFTDYGVLSKRVKRTDLQGYLELLNPTSASGPAGRGDRT